MKDFVSYMLFGYIGLFLASIAFLCLRVKRETGVFPIIRNTDRVSSFVDRVVLFSYVLVIINAVLYSVGRIELFSFFDVLELKIAGLAVIGLAMLAMFTAQMQMKENWRIGIDAKSKIKLVDSGLFRHFRHPIYLCAVIIGLGTVMVIPALSTLFIAFILWASVSTQARLEESFLLSKFGKKYADYIKKRGRYF